MSPSNGDSPSRHPLRRTQGLARIRTVLLLRKRIRTKATTRPMATVVWLATTTTLVILVCCCLEITLAFVVVSPSAASTARSTTTIATTPGIVCSTTTPPSMLLSSSRHLYQDGTRKKWQASFTLEAVAGGGSGEHQNSNKGKNNPKAERNNNNNANKNNNNRSNSRKKNSSNNKDSGSPKQNKKGGKKSNFKRTKKAAVVDSSKQKKREIMDQIKAKIKEEGEEKKKKQQQQQNSKQKPKSKQRPKNTQRQSQKKNQGPTKKMTPTANIEQKLNDDDFEPIDDASTSSATANKGKRLFMNPFEAGKSFRETLSSLSTLGRGLPKETKQKYFLDDRLLDGDENVSDFPLSSTPSSSSPIFANRLLRDFAAAEALEPSTYVPEVLVVGATGEIGRLVVRRLLLEGRGRFRVRVLVRDLYSQTLNLLGTGVSYCQGDLSNVESLEYALTDVDKIVCVAGAPKPDESDFQRKFRWYLEEQGIDYDDDNGGDSDSDGNKGRDDQQMNDREWEQLASVLEVRSELAEQVDCIGMKNLVSAYQNVRHTDYGTSQAAKRSLFKFSEKSGDFDLFALDDGESTPSDGGKDEGSNYYQQDYDDEEEEERNDDDDDDDDDKYADYYDEYNEYDEDYYDENYGVALESRNAKDANVLKSEVKWLRNKFHNGVFVGKVPRADISSGKGGEAAIISSRLRAREDPDRGIDMSNFAGLILRVVSDGNRYEAFVRTGLYESDGIEYVYEFGTDSKMPTTENKSKSRFKTVRLAFENFKPVQQRRKSSSSEGDSDEEEDDWTVQPFVGNDVQYIGFRFRSSSNMHEEDETSNRMRNSLDRLGGKNNNSQRFSMALAYIKVYRSQPEPEFIYLSDARIPPVVSDGMVHHDRKMLLTSHNEMSDERNSNEPLSSSSEKDATKASVNTLFDEKDLQRRSKLERSPEETYFKYRGEEILVKSGLSYTIVRVAGFNELSTSEASTIDLIGTSARSDSKENTEIVPVSRAEVAQVCVSALLDPSALNKIVYMTKKKVVGKNVLDEEDISAKFEGIPSDIVL